MQEKRVRYHVQLILDAVLRTEHVITLVNNHAIMKMPEDRVVGDIMFNFKVDEIGVYVPRSSFEEAETGDGAAGLLFNAMFLASEMTEDEFNDWKKKWADKKQD